MPPRNRPASAAAVPVVYDAGALVAADRGERSLWAQFAAAVADRRPVVVPSPVLTQAWRDGATQARLARLVAGCRVLAPDEQLARQAGVLLGRSHTSDAVDAIVVATAIALRAGIVTSDIDDIKLLAESADTDHQVAISRT
jgi:predicted nucleic acid-binding protein